MTVLDSSALLAVLRGEPEEDAFLAIIAESERCLLSAVSLLETSMVLAGSDAGATAWTRLDEFIAQKAIEVVAYDKAQAVLAREAFLRYGKGRHPAALNFGDCATYALAKQRGLRLLFKGEDFARTDIASAV